MTLKRAAAIMGINRDRARKLEQSAFRKIRENLAKMILDDPVLRDAYGDLIENGLNRDADTNTTSEENDD